MVKFITTLLVAMGISGLANAHHIKVKVGWLIGYNERTNEVYLNDGRAYYMSPRFNISSLNRGERFLVEFVQTKTHRNIVAVIPVPVMEEPLLTTVND